MPEFKPPAHARLLALLATCLLLGACATAPVHTPTESPQVSAALAAEDQGDWERAAAQWERQAQQTTGREMSTAWLRAADAWWKAGDALRSRDALDRVRAGDLDRSGRARHALLLGERALALSDAERAGFYLESAGSGLPRSERGRYRQALERLEALRNDPAALVLGEVAEMVDTPGPVDAPQAVRILQRLETVPGARLQAEALNPNRLGQWAALALDVRETLVRREDLLQAAREWATLNPLHPVDEQAYMEIAWQYGQQFTPPERIAVLLPLQGSLAAAARAIRDGLVAAWLDHPARAEMRFIDVGEDPQSALRAWRAAEFDGYQWVIGPLRRESVQTVADQPDIALPGLLLNWPESPAASPFPASPTPPPRETDLFSLSLSQQAEAQAVARRMLRDGHQQTILLLADNEWGERIETAFMDEYLAGGGRIVSLERFQAGDADHSAKLTRLLQIEDSRERKRRLQGALGIPLEFEDSRRNDFGAFFMAADPVLGRQLKPQLRFFDAGEKPVFAMSRVYAGRDNPGEDADLNGVVIPTTRMSLAADHDRDVTFASLRGGAFASLYALGRDAWDILPWLDLMRRNTDFAYPGAIGDLSLGEGGRLLRDPAWAQFRGGRPVPVDGRP